MSQFFRVFLDVIRQKHGNHEPNVIRQDGNISMLGVGTQESMHKALLFGEWTGG